MPIRPVPHSQENTLYYLICHDKQGDERSDDPDAANGILSHEVIRLAKSGQYTDVFLLVMAGKAIFRRLLINAIAGLAPW